MGEVNGEDSDGDGSAAALVEEVCSRENHALRDVAVASAAGANFAQAYCGGRNRHLGPRLHSPKPIRAISPASLRRQFAQFRQVVIHANLRNGRTHCEANR